MFVSKPTRVVAVLLLSWPVACGSTGGPESSDEAYCQLFVHRNRECFPPEAGAPSREDEVTECRAGRAAARALGRWDDDERRQVTTCLQKPDCEAVSACMAEP